MLGFLLLSLCGWAQVDKADRLFEAERYAEAARSYERALEKGDSSQHVFTNLGLSYKSLNNYKKAEEVFAQGVKIEPVDAALHLYYGQALKRNHKLAEARHQFKLFNQKAEGGLIGKLLVQSTDLIYQWANEPPGYEIRKLEGINSEKSDICPVLFQDGLVITTNRQEDLMNENYSSRNALPYYAVYYAPFDPADSSRLSFKEPRAFSGKLNSNYNDGPVSFAEEGKVLYFSRVEKSEKGKGFQNRIKIYSGFLNGERVREIVAFFLNSNDYSVAHPFLSADGKRLFFASDMPGGYGGFDIYYCFKEGEIWSEPINMGKGVNTRKSEVYPSVAPNGDLYFSSNGHAGYGGLDLFISKASLRYRKSENLKAPINSFTDDFGLAFVDGNTGYFSSDRAGGQGMDDIYAFVKLPPPPADQNATFTGILEYQNEPVSNVLLNLLTTDDVIISAAPTDSTGHFAFNYLDPGEQYRIEMVDAPQELVDSGRIFLTNSADEKVAIAQHNSNGTFAFQALSKDDIEDLAALTEEDLELGRFELFGQIYHKLAGESVEGLEIVALNDDGEVIAVTYTDKNGKFNFKELDRDQHYLFKISEDDPNLAVSINTIVNSGSPEEQAVNTNTPSFIFRKLSAADTNSIGLLALDDDSLLVKGVFEYNNLPAANVIIQIVDEYDNVIQTVVTDARGNFKFKKLAGDQAYMVRVMEEDGDILDEGLLVIEDGKQERVIQAKDSKDGVFVYRRLNAEQLSALTRVEASDDSLQVTGIIETYDKPSGFITLHLVDANNNIVETVTTDANGVFKFSKLAADANYVITVAEEDAEFIENSRVMLANEAGDQTLLARKTEDGVFVFRTLTKDQASDISSLSEDDAQPELVGVFGQLYKKLPGDFKEGIEVYALNDKGEIIDVAMTDVNGNFHFKKLGREDQYFLKLQEDDAEVQLVILESPEEIEAAAGRDLEGQFVYERLGIQRSRFTILSENDVQLLGEEPELAQEEEVDPVILPVPEGPVEQDKLIRTVEAPGYEILTIYYSFNSTLISVKAEQELDKLLAYLEENEDVRLEISSHTDAKGNGDYNMRLSKKRTYATIQYFSQRGIRPERLKGYWYGETRMVNDCGIGIWCPIEEHAKNRRTEFKLISTGKPLENLKL